MLAAQVGSIVNFSLMYFLAPTAGASAAGANLVQRLFSEQTLLAWGAPGAAGHCFRVGEPSPQAHAHALGLPCAPEEVRLLYEDMGFHAAGCVPQAGTCSRRAPTPWQSAWQTLHTRCPIPIPSPYTSLCLHP
jgi:hypothetical protein